MSLLVAPCSYAAAKHAVENWHYSQRMPASKLVRFGVWEDDTFIGCVIFGRGASNTLGAAYGLDATGCVELVRIALRSHHAPVSQIVARALAALHVQSPGVRLVVSFADPAQNHHGGIYQAGNWFYTGRTASNPECFWEGRWLHVRHLDPMFGHHTRLSALTREQQRALPTRRPPGKYRYIYPLDRAMRRRVAPLGQQYPEAS